MTTGINPKNCLASLLAVLGMLMVSKVTAQTLTTLHSFTATNPPGATNSDGALPDADLILSSSILYGTANGGGISGHGTVFTVDTDGTDFTDLHSFAGYPTDGAGPTAGLILSGCSLYGTAGGNFGSGHYGTIFAVNTNGMDFTNLHYFAPLSSDFPYTNNDGAYPYSALVLSNDNLYGTTPFGGRYGNGTVFALHTNGTSFRTLHDFNGSDGGNPFGGLMLLNNTLYGTTWQGVRPTNGTVFSIHTDGTSFTNLHIFTALDNFGNNSDGAFPSARLIASGNTLFGTAAYGGASGSGVVFKVNVDGTGFTNLHSFSGGSDGANPFAGLLLSGNTLYGTAEFGGTAGSGTVFALNTVDTAVTSLHCFTATSSDSSGVYTNNDGANPVGGLILSSNILYGTTRQGGNSGKGTVFSISFSPQLSVIISAANLILKWPTNYAGFNYTGFTLQSTTNLGSSAFWTTNSSAPVVVNGLNTVTNPISGTQQFFRLSK